MVTQQLSISWLGGAASTFDLMILRTELNETVFYVRAFLSFLICYATSWLHSHVKGAFARPLQDFSC